MLVVMKALSLFVGIQRLAALTFLLSVLTSASQTPLQYFTSEHAQYLLVMGITRGENIICLSNRNIHSSIDDVYQHPSTTLSTLEKGGGDCMTMKDTESDGFLHHSYVKVPKYETHSSGGNVSYSVHDISLLRINQEGLSHSLCSHSTVLSSDRVFYVQFPSARAGARQTVIISRRNHTNSITIITIYLPTRKVHLLHEKLTATTCRSCEKLEVVFSSTPSTIRTYGNVETVKFNAEKSQQEMISCIKGDLTGMKVLSAQPAHSSWTSGYDVMEEQLIAPSQYSTRYTIPIPSLIGTLLHKYQGMVMTVMAIAGEEMASVDFCGIVTAKLPPRVSKEMVIRSEGCDVRSDQPISVLATTTLLSSIEYDITTGFALYSVLPQHMWSNYYTLNLKTGGYDYYLILVASERDVRSLLHNENILSDVNWQKFGQGDHMTSMLLVPSGKHRFRMRLPHTTFAAYLMTVTNHSLGVSPAYISRYVQANKVCENTVSYNPDRFAASDHIDNDCDGYVDEELCIGSFLNTDDDGDGLQDEDCAGWSHTSYMDSCTSTDECNVYGQKFQCMDGYCLCPVAPLPPIDTDIWFYDNLDGLCWPIEKYNSIGGQVFHSLPHECGASFFIRYVEEEESCVCHSYANPKDNGMSCHRLIGDTYCSNFRRLCHHWQECIGSNTDFVCIEPARCYGDRSKQCPKGMTCLLEKGQPFCQDITDECDTKLGHIICPMNSLCVDGLDSFSCVPATHPCDNEPMQLACHIGYRCEKISSESGYKCSLESTDETDICQPLACLDGYLCVPAGKDYICQLYLPCSLLAISHNCTHQQVCLAVDGGYICLPVTTLLLQEQALNVAERRTSLILIGMCCIIFIIPLACCAAKTRQSRIEAKKTAQYVDKINAHMNIIAKLELWGKQTMANAKLRKLSKGKRRKNKSLKRKSKKKKKAIEEAALSLTVLQRPSAHSTERKHRKSQGSRKKSGKSSEHPSKNKISSKTKDESVSNSKDSMVTSVYEMGSGVQKSEYEYASVDAEFIYPQSDVGPVNSNRSSKSVKSSKSKKTDSKVSAKSSRQTRNVDSTSITSGKSGKPYSIRPSKLSAIISVAGSRSSATSKTSTQPKERVKEKYRDMAHKAAKKSKKQEKLKEESLQQKTTNETEPTKSKSKKDSV